MIYLDYNATTPVDPEVTEFMQPYLATIFANPSSNHQWGSKARQAVEEARAKVAKLLHAEAEEIIFTSGGTESNNHAIKGAAFARQHLGKHIIVSAIEHPSVMEAAQWLAKQGFNISVAPVDGAGFVLVDEFKKLIRPDTILASVMHSNNETGCIQPIAELAALASKHHFLFHCDAAQSIGKIPVDVQALGVDIVSLAGHKFYAPKGVGALYLRKGVVIENLMHGAAQERNQRAGTENLPQIAGIGEAARLAGEKLGKVAPHLSAMRDLLRLRLQELIPSMHFHSPLADCLPNTLSAVFSGCDANTLLSALPGVAASAGSACHAYGSTVSQVLEAMHVSVPMALSTIRFSTGRQTTAHEVEEAATTIAAAYRAIAGQGSSDRPVVENNRIKLTQFTHGLGCACKIRPSELEKILSKLPLRVDEKVLVGHQTSDDAAVYRLTPEMALVQTLDFFTPVVDDAYQFGAIAAANSLSDIYAMGAKPLFALNIVAFPTARLPMEVLQQILDGAAQKAAEAGISIVGGHSIDDTEPKYGLSVCGLVHPDKIWRNVGAKPGDALMLTKAIGTGIISTGIKKGIASTESSQAAMQSMATLNAKSADILSHFPVNACTDITGFGLMGHLFEMCSGSAVNVKIHFDRIPFMPGVKALALAGAIPGGSRENLSHFGSHIHWGHQISETEKLMICDAQTSGGLLVAVPGDIAAKAVSELKQGGIHLACLIGEVLESGEGWINVA